MDRSDLRLSDLFTLGLAVVSGLVEVSGLHAPRQQIAGFVIILCAVGVFLAGLTERRQNRIMAASDRAQIGKLSEQIVGLKSDILAAERESRKAIIADAVSVLERMGAAPGTLMYRAVALVDALSGIVEPFLEKEAPLLNELQRAMHPRLDFTTRTVRQINHDISSVELDTLKAYRNLQSDVPGLVRAFQDVGVRDDFMDAFSQMPVAEPYRILQLRDGIYRLIRRYGTQHKAEREGDSSGPL